MHICLPSSFANQCLLWLCLHVTSSVCYMNWFPSSFHGPVPGNSLPIYQGAWENPISTFTHDCGDEWAVPRYPMSLDRAVLPSHRGAGHSNHSLVKYKFPLRKTRLGGTGCGELSIPKMTTTTFRLYMFTQNHHHFFNNMQSLRLFLRKLSGLLWLFPD